MVFNHRKMFVPCRKNCNLTIVIPWFRTYPSPLPPPPPPPPPPPQQREPSLILPIWICVGSSIVLFIFLTICLYHYIRQPRSTTSSATVTPSDTNRREEDEETEERDFSDFHHVWRIPTAGLHRSVINSITVVEFKKGVIDGTECSVCLSEFEENESLRLLPKCSHAFHINCIDTWLLSHKNCPLCRAPVAVLTKPAHQETDSESSNDLFSGRQEISRSRSRNSNILPRAQSDLANHCERRVENVRRSSSIGGSLSLCDVNNVATRNGRQFYTSFSGRFLSSSRQSRNQEPILPN